ncbi:hypothetical protein [Serratia entomophila]|uniref:hypothetical protein n=1 Tax=Serratia entomophila TaxID=42906 RepID=UPI002179DE44|nr:hypothetical protein [Serratia entomophila]CAI1514815.1 Uncharacterised protein [Serratia entomophila]CAI1949600.1 Uncharacterised protein [Serratia entomophila]
MDKIREEFEEWWNNKMAMCFYSLPKSQKETISHASWIAWQASRASIVVALPDSVGIECNVCADVAIKRCEESIRSIGLSIKGE